MQSDPESDALHVLDSFRRIVQALRESERAVGSSDGISGAQLLVLQKLQEGGGATIGELAARTLTHQSSVSAVVAKLESRGLVQRRPGEEDRRRVRVTLTPRGSAMAARVPAPSHLRLLEAVQALSPSEQRRLGVLLERLATTMQPGRRGAPPMFFEEQD